MSTPELELPAEGPAPLPVSAAAPTDESRAEALAAEARALVDDVGVRRSLALMLALRRAYALAHAGLAQGRDPAVVEILAASIAHKASEAFDVVELFRGFGDNVLPWLTDLVQSLTDEEKATRKQEAEAADAARRARPVPLLPGVVEADRARGLVLVGPRGVVQWVLDCFCAAASDPANEPPSCVLRFAALDHATPAAPPEGVRMVRITRQRWRGCGNSANGMMRVVGAHVVGRMAVLPDLLVCDDLPAAVTNGLTVAHPAQLAAQAYRVLGKWASEAGCALLGGVDVGDPSDLECPPWKALSKHARVVSCRYEDADGWVTLCDAEGGGPWHMPVAYEDLAAYLPRRVVLT